MVSSPVLSFLVVVVLAVMLGTVSALVPVVPMTVEVNLAQSMKSSTASIMASSSQFSYLQGGIENYMSSSSSVSSSNVRNGGDGVVAGPSLVTESSTLSLSLKDRPPPPTKEEIEAKKRNFNLWFWGGGFVAPFIATIYYFGPKFWTK